MALNTVPYRVGETAGAIYSAGKRLSLIESSLTNQGGGFVQKGEVIRSGELVGMSLTDTTAATDRVEMLTEGIVSLLVLPQDIAGSNDTIAIGDGIYFDETTPALRADASAGVFVGVALAALTGSATASTIPVWLGPKSANTVESILETLTAAAPAAGVTGVSLLDSGSNAVNATLADSVVIGTRKLFVMSDASNSSTVTVANHLLGSSEIFTFAAVGEHLELIWTGADWNTASVSASTVVHETLTAAAPAASLVRETTLIDSNLNAVDATLASGTSIGQRKFFVMTDASNSSTLTVALHEDGASKVFTFDATNEAVELEWGGAAWHTIALSATEVISETLTASGPTLSVILPNSLLDSSGNAVDGTLPSGLFIGQQKLIVMTEASNSSQITITNHETTDPELATFDAVDEYGLFQWTGTEWVTISATCTFV